MSVQLESAVGERLRFGEFELAPVARTLRRRGEEIKLGSRALDILIALASRPGQILSKDDLTKLVWRGAFVDETALRVGISAVRKALGNGGDQCITTVPGRGYCFVLDVEIMAAKSAAEPLNFKQIRPHRLPAQTARIVGLDEVIAALTSEATLHRLLSLVGLSAAQGVTILATSRERLRAAGEWVHQLSPLDVPPASSSLSAEEVRRYPAVEMFEERAASALGGFQINETDAPYVAEICRRLDGIALAIELAAGRLAGPGVQGLANSVGDCFAILTRGRRAAVPRHQTLRATLDWSYQLLTPEDQAALRCLSVFNGSFTPGASRFRGRRQRHRPPGGDAEFHPAPQGRGPGRSPLPIPDFPRVFAEPPENCSSVGSHGREDGHR
jgi:DNA-binding winged helix-turn-helix (wHTH) protein